MIRNTFAATCRICLSLALLGLAEVPFPLKAETPGGLTSSNLPIIIIDTGGKNIPDLVRIRASMKIIYNGQGKRNAITDAPNNYSGLIDIELRGSSSIAYPKKGYRLETVDASGNNLNVPLLGMPKENDWILYASYDDQSLMRNVLAYRLSLEIGRYAPRVRFCELVLNNDYRGVYVFMEKIKQDKNRVNITEMKPEDRSGDAVTGGYIWKFDKIEGEQTAGWNSNHGIFYQFHDPKADDLVGEQMAYIRDFMNVFETVMILPSPGDSTFGYPRYIDVDSFVDHFLLSEFCKNIDAYRISTFMYKDRDSKGGKLKAGPIWDFNLSFGKTWYPEDSYRVDEWEIDHNRYKPDDWPKVPFWWEKLGHDALFASRVKSRWSQLSQTFFHPDSLDRRIDLLADSLAEARGRNSERWPETTREHSYEVELFKLKQWIRGRTMWIVANLGRLSTVDDQGAGEGQVRDMTLYQNYPNPFNQRTLIRFDLPRDGLVTLNIYTTRGEKVATLLNEPRSAGPCSITWDGAGMASGLYFCRLEAGSFRQVRKLILAR